jgi:heterodisulfide reductase subunit D
MSKSSNAHKSLLSPEQRLAHINKKKKKLMEACTACGVCLKTCPIFTQGRYKDQKPREIMLKVLDLINNDKHSEEAAYTVLTCTSCGECTSRCPEKLIPLLLFRAGVEKLSEIGKAPPRVSDFTQLLSVIQTKPSDASWLDKTPEDFHRVDIVMFPGCDSIRAPHEILTHIDILEKININFVTLWNEDLCCGFKGYSVNDFEKGDQLAKNLISAIEAFRPKTLLLPCAQCYFQFARTISKLFSFSFEFIYFPQFLSQNLDRIKFGRKINKVVTYHDSCKIARAVRDFDTIRELLKKIPGIKLVEMERNREKSICCGGLNNFSYPELTSKMGEDRLDQAVKVGADILVTDCTLCYSMYAIREDFYPFEVKHYSAVIAEAMGIKPREDTYKKILHMSPKRIFENARENIESRGIQRKKIEVDLEMFMDIVKKLRSKTKGLMSDISYV